MLKIGSHVGMKGKEMFLGSVKEACSYGANTFMVFTGAPQNTRRKPIEELNIDAGRACMKKHGISEVIVHAPYLINLANCVNPDTFRLAVEFLSVELSRAAAMHSRVLVLHPGAHVGAGADAGIHKIIEGLNEVLSKDTSCFIALETMAGKGSEIGRRLEELAAVYDGVVHSEKLRVCLDTCHLHDAGYDVIYDFDGIVERLDRLVGKEQAAVLHINDSRNPCGLRKDRHANIGEGWIGFEALNRIVHHPDFSHIPKILETPWRPSPEDPDRLVPPYKEEILLFKSSAPDSAPNSALDSTSDSVPDPAAGSL